MKKVISGLRYKGEPVYEEWSADRTSVEWSSRETKKSDDGSWKLLRSVPLHSVKVDRRYGSRRVCAWIEAGRQAVLRMKGIKADDDGGRVVQSYTRML